MKSILFTIIVMLSTIGLGVGVYLEKWDTVIVNAPFTMHFVYLLIAAYQQDFGKQNQHQAKEIERLENELRKQRKILAQLIKQTKQ